MCRLYTKGMLNSSEKYINVKVVSGFSLLFILALLAFAINYVSIVNISSVGVSGDPLGKQVSSLSQLVFLLQEAEGEARLYSISGDRENHQKYEALNDSVSHTLDNLHTLFTDSLFTAHLDTVSILFDLKKKQMAQLIEVRTIERHRKRYGEVLSLIPDSLVFEANQVVDATLHVDTLTFKENVEDNKSIFGKIAGLLGGNEKEKEVQYKPEVEQRIDSGTIQSLREAKAIEQVRDEVASLNRRDRNFVNIVRKKEEELVNLGEELQNKIRQVVHLMEDEALQQSAGRALLLEQLKSDMRLRMILLGCSALCIVLLFILWISRDIRKSRKLNEQLILSSKNVERLARVKEQFLANMSHEIRTPLTSIIGFSEQIKNQVKEAGIIHNSALHLLSLVNNVLDYSMLGSGKLNLVEEEVDLQALIIDLCRPLQIKAEAKDLDFTFEKKTELGQVTVDKTRVRQILVNLINNAIKFTDEGCVVLVASIREMTMRFEVIDSGCGLAPKDQAVIFDEFSQINPDNASEGSGLGLAICKKLVDAMGGEIGLQSQVNEGSLFWVEIPYKAAEGISVNAEEIDLKLLEQSVLVVDDDPVICDLMRAALEDKVKKLLVSESPLEALEFVKRMSFDLIVCDYRMPEMDGGEFIQAIRTKYNAEMPVLVLSAGISDTLISLVNQQKGVHLMSKPFAQQDLLQKMADVLLGKSNMTRNKTLDLTSDALINLDGIKAFTGNDEEFFNALIVKFIEQSQLNIQTLGAMIENGHYEEVQNQAHKMKTGFAQFGINEGLAIIKAIEALSKSEGNNREIKASLKRLKQLWHKVEQELVVYT